MAPAASQLAPVRVQCVLSDRSLRRVEAKQIDCWQVNNAQKGIENASAAVQCIECAHHRMICPILAGALLFSSSQRKR